MKSFPDVGDILVVRTNLETGLDDCTSSKAICRDTLCIVLSADARLYFDHKEYRYGNARGSVLTLLFPDGVINWDVTWAAWHFYLRIVEDTRSAVADEQK